MLYNSQMWTVNVSKKASKQYKKLPKAIKGHFVTLLRDLTLSGPVVCWQNFSKLSGKKNVYHCHIKKGNPTYVAVWSVIDKQIKVMEVHYVGTHEKAPY